MALGRFSNHPSVALSGKLERLCAFGWARGYRVLSLGIPDKVLG